MDAPAWLVTYAVILLVGLVVGLLLRFLIVLVVVVAVFLLLSVWFLAFLDPGALGQLLGGVNHLFGDLSLTPELLYTSGTLVFLAGVVGGVLLTTRLRGLERPRPQA